METELKDIMWGSNFFVNAQFALGLVSWIEAYAENKLPLDNLFAYGSAIQKQKKTPGISPHRKMDKTTQRTRTSNETQNTYHS